MEEVVGSGWLIQEKGVISQFCDMILKKKVHKLYCAA